MNYLTGVISDIGIEKQTNQDSALIKIAEINDTQIAMVLVCDGMGGLAKGELASATVIRSFSDWYEKEMANDFEKPDFWNVVKTNWRTRIEKLNDELNEYAKKIHTNLGTTITGVLMSEGKYLIVNVGDSRTYLLNDDIAQITEDQSLVAREIKMGRLTEEEAEYDTRRNVLLQCVGATKSVEVEFYEGEAQSGEAFLLCSDGFRHEITQKEMIEKLRPSEFISEQDIEARIKELVELNKTREENDNITAAVIKLL